MTLPLAASVVGRCFTLQKAYNDSTFNAVTITRAGSDTINAGDTSTSLNTEGECLVICAISAGSWKVITRTIPSLLKSYTPTLSWVAGITSNTAYYQRIGSFIKIQSKIVLSGAPTSAGLTLSVPSGLTIASGSLVTATGTNLSLGTGTATDAGSANYISLVGSYVSTTLIGIGTPVVSGATVISGSVTESVPFTFGATDSVVTTLMVPITGWNG